MDREQLLQESIRIGDVIAATAIHHRGTASWVHRTIQYATADGSARERQPTLQPLNASVYSGTAGVGLYLAYLARASGSRTHRAAAVGALQHAVKHAWQSYPDDRELPIGSTWRYGFYMGALGIAWAAHEVGTILDEPRLASASRRLVEELRATGHDKPELDLMFGYAGAIPALVDLAKQGRDDAGELAIDLGRALAGAARHDERGASWKVSVRTLDPKNNLLGLSHGVAGIAASLATLYDWSGEGKYRDLALEGFAYERSFYDPEGGNWPHFGLPPLPGKSYGEMLAWCHGAPGIGVGRAVSIEALRDPKVEDDLRLARATTAREIKRQVGEAGTDHQYCHGIAGNAEALWIMDEALFGSDKARSVQLELAGLAIDRYGRASQDRWGSFALWPTAISNGLHPALMTGGAGVGMYLLRLADPSLPSALFPAYRP